jgi:hypothetical protein
VIDKLKAQAIAYWNDLTVDWLQRAAEKRKLLIGPVDDDIMLALKLWSQNENCTMASLVPQALRDGIPAQYMIGKQP